ncbi:hypothetical protein FHG87_003675, partial [Trinorchestia longiramus]
MLQCAPYIRSLCENINPSFSSEVPQQSCHPDNCSSRTLTTSVAAVASSSPSLVTTFTGGALQAVSCSKKTDVAASSLSSVAAYTNAVVTAPKAGSAQLVAICSNASNHVRQEVLTKRSTLPWTHVHKTESFKGRSSQGKGIGCKIAVASFPNLDVFNREASASNLSLSGVPESNGDDRNRDALGGSTEGVSVVCHERAPRFIGSSFVGTHPCLTSKKILQFNSLNRPIKNNFITLSPTTIGNSSISSNSSSAVSLSEISEDAPFPVSSANSSIYDNCIPQTSFCSTSSAFSAADS